MKTKTPSTGLFFEKRSQPSEGRFFRDLPGREDATYCEKQAFDTKDPSKPSKVNVGITGAPDSDAQVALGKEQGAGIYGSGEGLRERIREGGEKKAGAAPSDWDADSGLPTGFHRPASSQPEALESGGDRFNATTADGPRMTARNGLVEGGKMRVRKNSGHQMGKHASVQSGARRFMGTSLDIEKSAAISGRELGSTALDTAKKTGRQARDTAEDLLERGAKSPIALGVGALLAARLGFRGLRGVGRGALRAAGKAPAKEPGMVAGAVGKLKKMMTDK